MRSVSRKCAQETAELPLIQPYFTERSPSKSSITFIYWRTAQLDKAIAGMLRSKWLKKKKSNEPYSILPISLTCNAFTKTYRQRFIRALLSHSRSCVTMHVNSTWYSSLESLVQYCTSIHLTIEGSFPYESPYDYSCNAMRTARVFAISYITSCQLRKSELVHFT